jgi:hypothetical protein
MTAEMAASVAQKVSRQQIAFMLLCLARFMVILDASIVNVALPSIQSDFGFSTQTLRWVVSIYSLTFGGLLLSGRAGDLFGRQRIPTPADQEARRRESYPQTTGRGREWTALSARRKAETMSGNKLKTLPIGDSLRLFV